MDVYLEPKRKLRGRGNVGYNRSTGERKKFLSPKVHFFILKIEVLISLFYNYFRHYSISVFLI